MQACTSSDECRTKSLRGEVPPDALGTRTDERPHECALEDAIVDAGAGAGAGLCLRKQPGPREDTSLLSNRMIDAALARWARLFPGFRPCPFAMADYENYEFGAYDWEAFARASLAAPATFACVHNTAHSTDRRGKHWVTTFARAARGADGAPEASLEFFNSSGRAPAAALAGWLEATRARLAAAYAALGEPRARVTAGAVSDVAHQRGRTECGVYALYYIRRRLEGTPPAFFREVLVPDDTMTAFRRHIFT